MNAFTLRCGKELDDLVPQCVSKKDNVSSEEVEEKTPPMVDKESLVVLENKKGGSTRFPHHLPTSYPFPSKISQVYIG